VPTFDIDPIAAGFDPGRLTRITNHLRRNFIDPGKIAGCQTLVARHGKVAHFESLGVADLESAASLRDDAIFRYYSMTKPITSVALMTLYERGHFQLNDPVSKFIPSFKNHKVWVSGSGENMALEAPRRAMTVRDLLCHTSGLTYGSILAGVGAIVEPHPVEEAYDALGVSDDRDQTLADLARQLANVPLRFHPGERWMYSLATEMCAYLVEVISGQRFDDYLQTEILGPLGMVDTGFWVPPAKVDRLTTSYGRRRDKSLTPLDSPSSSIFLAEPGFLSGGGGLLGTMADYFRFSEMLRRGGELDGHRVLGPRTIDMMRRNHLAGGQDLTQMSMGGFSETAYDGVGFGLGFAQTLGEVATGTLGHGDYYWGGAASTIFWVDPVEDMVVIFLTQLMPSGTFNFRGQLKNIIYSAIV
jgi:CubicO group peptidase (beta-lactamase class C family)